MRMEPHVNDPGLTCFGRFRNVYKTGCSSRKRGSYGRKCFSAQSRNKVIL